MLLQGNDKSDSSGCVLHRLSDDDLRLGVEVLPYLASVASRARPGSLSNGWLKKRTRNHDPPHACANQEPWLCLNIRMYKRPKKISHEETGNPDGAFVRESTPTAERDPILLSPPGDSESGLDEDHGKGGWARTGIVRQPYQITQRGREAAFWGVGEILGGRRAN